MTGVNVKAQRRPIFDKAEDLDKHTKRKWLNSQAAYVSLRNQTSVVQAQAYKPQIRYAPVGGGKMQLTMQKVEHNL